MRIVRIGGLYIALVLAIAAFVGGARGGDDPPAEDEPTPPPRLEPEVRDALARRQPTPA